MMMTFADKIISFNRTLRFDGTLPDGIRVMNPFLNNPEVLEISEIFYRKFYSDIRKRIIVLGINPGRFGAGTTGIPFTDTVRLEKKCGIALRSNKTHEPSSAFIYEMIDAYGSVEKFYSSFLLSAICPLGFVKNHKDNQYINYNYYDSPALVNAVYDFIVLTLKQQLDFGIRRDVVFCLGTGKNVAFLQKLNNTYRFFDKIIPLEHPRYIMQYKSKTKEVYIQKYLDAFNSYEAYGGD